MIPTRPPSVVKHLYAAYHTLARMHPRQVVGMGERKARGLLIPRLPVDFDRWYERRVPAEPSLRLTPIAGNTATFQECLGEGTRERYRRRATEAADGAPTFLNRTLRVAEGTTVDWYDDRFDDLPGDWSYKLYAFQPLSWICRGFDPEAEEAPTLRRTFDGWIRNWMDSVEIGRPGYLRRAWTPWSVSLRILRWCRYLAWRAAAGSTGERDDFERAASRELYKNALFLHNHVERDVGGNHLIENGAALVVAGLVLSERSWVDTGLSILSEAAVEQFLDDGCHFERSPMYHVLVVTRYLTVCDVLDRAGRPIPDEVRTAATEATAFLRYVRPPDGRIPLLNDSVYGEAVPLDECLRYADAIGVGDGGDEPARTAIDDEGTQPTSEYRWLTTADGAMLIDGGAVGPPHLPGHSHSDTLGVLLWLDERPVVTDTGTFGYVSGRFRNYARGVRGHNTVQVDDTEPIALGGKYLMGPRLEPETRFEDGTVSLFEGRYEATPFGGPPYTHHRAAYAGDRWWVVWDTVRSPEGGPVRSQLHLHPDVTPGIEATGRVSLAPGGGEPSAFVHPLGPARTSIRTGWYFPRFGAATQRPVLELESDDAGDDTASFGFLVTRRDVRVATIETGDGGPVPERLHAAAEVRLPDVRLLPE